MRKRIGKPAFVVAAVASALISPALGAPAQANTEQSTASSNQPGGERKEFVVVAKKGHNVNEIDLPDDARVTQRYSSAFSGYAVTMTRKDAAKLADDPRVDAIVEDKVMGSGQQSPTCPPGGFDTDKHQCLPTGIDRIEADGSSTVSGNNRGEVPVNVAVVDSGSGPHRDLNIVGGKDCTGEGSGFDDLNGHGTIDAGIVGARDNGIGVVGVAPGARLWSVRILDKELKTTLLKELCGFEFIASTRQDKDRTNDIEVANLSFAGSGSDDENCGLGRDGAAGLEHQAICRLVRLGVTVVASAGNAGKDFVGTIPATYSEVLTVTAVADLDGRSGGRAGASDWRSDCAKNAKGESVTNKDDTPAVLTPPDVGSNWAKPKSEDAGHTIAAPGACIVSTFLGNDYNVGSGTSQAAPHVAGTAALCIAKGACRRPAQTIKKLVDDAARYNRENRSYGFEGDPRRPLGKKYYGNLIRASLY